MENCLKVNRIISFLCAAMLLCTAVFTNSMTVRAMQAQGEAVTLGEVEETAQMKVKITAGGQELIADLEDNATTRALWDILPLTVPMMDLYSREMCYRFTEALPTENFRSDSYEVGDLVYWAPGHSLVILYKQNGEQFSRQQLGHIQSGVEIFDGMGDVNVTFEKYTEQEPGETVPPESGTEETEHTEVNRPNPGNQQTAPGKGTILTDDKKQMHYKVTKAGFSGGTVEYLKSTNRKATSITIPGTVSINGITYKVTGIAAQAFKDNKRIVKIKVGSNVLKIGKSAFDGCTKLKSISIGTDVTSIGDKAFYKCTSLTKITVPGNVTKIGARAFANCSKLKSIHIKTAKLTKRSTGSRAFKGIHAKAVIKVPEKKLKSYKNLLKKCGISGKKQIIRK